MTPESITFRQEIEDGKPKLYVEKDWPDCILVSLELLRNGVKDHFELRGGALIVTVANGSADYRLASEQLSDTAVTFIRLTSSFSEPPKPNAEPVLRRPRMNWSCDCCEGEFQFDRDGTPTFCPYCRSTKLTREAAAA